MSHADVIDAHLAASRAFGALQRAYDTGRHVAWCQRIYARRLKHWIELQWKAQHDSAA